MCGPQFSLNLEVEFDNDPGMFGGSATNRKCTDIFGLLIVVLLFGTVIGLTVYCSLNGDAGKLMNGYDDNGNICGKKKYVFIKEDATLGQTKECVENCTKPGTSLVHNYCVTDEQLIPYHIIIVEDIWNFIFVSLAASVLAVLTTYIVVTGTKKYKSAYKLLTIICCLLALISICITRMSKLKFALWVYSIFAIVIVIWHLSFLFIYFTYKSTQIFILPVQLYREAEKSINVKQFLFLPLLSMILVVGFIVMLIYCWIWTQSFSYLHQLAFKNSEDNKIKYIPYLIATVTGALLIYTFILFYEIVKNCQCFIVGGYVAQWYFTRNDPEVHISICRIIGNLLKYHLGSICCASLLLPIIYVVRGIINGIKGAASGNNKESIYTCSCRLLSETCLGTYVTCLNFFTQNGLVMTAMYGSSYCKGTIRAHKLFTHNIFNLAAINTFRGLILGEIRFIHLAYFIFVGCSIVKYTLKQQLIMLLCFVIACIILSELFVSVIDVAIDTLILCFCEDCEYNMGTSKPFYMSPNFAQFIENANEFVDPVKWKRVAEVWKNGPKHLYL